MSGSYLFYGSILEKCGNLGKNGRFSRRIWPDWGNTARADMAGLGSIGLTVKPIIIPLPCENTRVGPLCLEIPPTREFCVGDTNMLVSKICVTPNANPQCEQVEYRSRSVLNAKFTR